MNVQKETQRIILVEEHSILNWIEAFLLDCKVRLAKGTVKFYRSKMNNFWKYCHQMGIYGVQEVSSNTIREFLLYLQTSGYNQGGVHAYFRSIKAFLNWYEREIEQIDWKNPIKNIKTPRLDIVPLEPADKNAIQAMISMCDRSYCGIRDKAIILTLADTGVRASELIALNHEDVDAIKGVLIVRHSKSGKYRTVFLGRKARQALRSYISICTEREGALFISKKMNRMTYDVLRSILKRRARQASAKYQSPHAFRRFFALEMLRAGVDVFTLQLLMGHSDIQVLRRYLKQVDGDLQEAHRKASPVDNWRL